MAQQDQPEPGALPEGVTDDDASSTELEPSSSQSQSTPPAAGEEPDLRQIQAQHGRELAAQRAATEAAQRALVQQTQETQALKARQQQTEAYLADQQKRQTEAYLNSLPPEKRQAEENRLLRARVDALEKRPPIAAPASQGRTESDEDYTARRSRELIAAINKEAGLSGDDALTGDEDELDWDDERGFIGSARTLAKIRSKGNGTVAQKNNQNGSGSGGSGGASRPLNARPSGGSGRKVDAAGEANVVFARNANPRSGVKKKLANLDDIRKRAHEALPRR